MLLLESRLAALHYPCGTVDGKYDYRTKDAVMAFQKYERFKRTGVVDGAVWQHLLVAQAPTPVLVKSGRRVEVDLTRQVLMMIVDNQVIMTIHVSTGKFGTPTGTWHIRTLSKGWRMCSLGPIYSPCYFMARNAIHGYPSVPTYPASHGCVRTPIWVQNSHRRSAADGDPGGRLLQQGPLQPPAGAPADATAGRNRSSAARAARSRIWSRRPKSRSRSTSVTPLTTLPMKTNPTGFSSVPPPGPARPRWSRGRSRRRAAGHPLSHGRGHLGAHRPVLRQQLRRHAQHLRLHLVAVRRHSAEEVVAAARHVGETLAHQPAGARLGHRDGEPALQQQPAGDLGQPRPVHAKHPVAEDRAHPGLDLVQAPRRLPAWPGPSG